jgi:hypothetical protein
VSLKIFLNMMIKTTMTAIITKNEMIEDIFPRFSLSKNLVSCIFNKLQRKSGGYCDNKKFNDNLHINCFIENDLTALILSEQRDKREKSSSKPQRKMKIKRRTPCKIKFGYCSNDFFRYSSGGILMILNSSKIILSHIRSQQIVN